MKRSRISEITATADRPLRHSGFVLPPFAKGSPTAFKANAPRAGRVIKGRCGWAITDDAQGRYDQMSRFLFTLRNGPLADLQRGGGSAVPKSF